VQLIGGFVPAAGDAFNILTAADRLGTFDAYALPPLAAGLEWLVDYRPTSVWLVAGPSADFDVDGDVDGADFLSWQP
jgi:hypothetical protein